MTKASQAVFVAALADAGGPSDEQRLQRGLQRNQQRNRCGGRVPAGWLESPCGGANIFGIAPVKTPLSSVFDLPSGAESWTPAECVDKCGGAAAVAVVIDLTPDGLDAVTSVVLESRTFVCGWDTAFGMHESATQQREAPESFGAASSGIDCALWARTAWRPLLDSRICMPPPADLAGSRSGL